MNYEQFMIYDLDNRNIINNKTVYFFKSITVPEKNMITMLNAVYFER